MKINDCGWFHRVILGGIFMLGIEGIVASGGGDGEEEEEIIISAFYNFQLGGPLEGDAGNSVIGIVRQGEFSLSTEPNLQGEVICDQNTEICWLQAVEAGSIDITGQITTDPGPPPTTFNVDINIMVEDIFRWGIGGAEFPFDGSLLITPAAGGSPISVEVTNCIGGNVLVTVNSPGICYSWEDFEGLLDDAGSSPEELQASLAWGAVAFIVEQGLNSLEVFPLIVDDAFAVRGNPITESCETWLGDWTNPPTLNPGYLELFWSDDAGPGQVGSGDSFSQTFNDCWFGDSTDGTLLDGSIDYVGYIEEIDFKYLLTRIGFVKAPPGSVEIGGVAFDSLVITETTQLGNDITADSPITLTGRYLIVFFR